MLLMAKARTILATKNYAILDYNIMHKNAICEFMLKPEVIK